MVLFRLSYVWKICDFFFFKQKTAYEMRISDWSSDVCSSDLLAPLAELLTRGLWHADDLEGSVLAAKLYSVADLLERRPQVAVVNRADDAVVAPDLVGVKGLPLAIGHLRHVADHSVNMALRIARPAGKIGRAAWRESVCQYGVVLGGGGSLKKKKLHETYNEN